MKLYPLVLAFAGAGFGLLLDFLRSPALTNIQTAGVNLIPLRVTLVSSGNQIGPSGNSFDNPPAAPCAARTDCIAFKPSLPLKPVITHGTP